MAKSKPSVLDHPGLGQLRGHVSEDRRTVQFRNLKFASIPGRWRDPIPSHGKLSAGQFDARKFGPVCPQHPAALDVKFGILDNCGFPSQEMIQSELECLNLVVTVPVLADCELSKLPVMVWVHGGGMSIGSNSFPQYNLANFVAATTDAQVPVIGVSINYRVGVLGFLASDVLGTSGNFGLKDQACAFEWVRRNIAGFGGNPEQITAFGESAGAITLSALLLTDQPLFSRVILMSGEVTLRNARNKDWHNTYFERVAHILGLDKLSPDEQKKKLYEIEAEKLVAMLPIFDHWSPAIDGQFLKKQVNLGILSDETSNVGRPNWCKEMVIGDMKHDGTVLRARFVDAPDAAQRVHKATRRLFTTAEMESLLLAYSIPNIEGAEVDPLSLVDLITDLRFHLGTLKTYEGWRKRGIASSYRYHVHQANTVEGAMKGLASHELDVGILFQNIVSIIKSDHGHLSRDMTRIWASFAYGLGWPQGDKGEDILVLGPNSSVKSYSDEEYDRILRRGRGQLMYKLDWKRCFQLGEMLQGCYVDDE